jgi:hypothetical protein
MLNAPELIVSEASEVSVSVDGTGFARVPMGETIATLTIPPTLGSVPTLPDRVAIVEVVTAAATDDGIAAPILISIDSIKGNILMLRPTFLTLSFISFLPIQTSPLQVLFPESAIPFTYGQ